MTVTNTNDRAGICNPENRTAFVSVLDRIGDKWTILIIAELFPGPLRYNELQRRVGAISQRMLTLSLKALVTGGFITRTASPSIPPRVEYELTVLGHSLREALEPLWNWALVNMRSY